MRYLLLAFFLLLPAAGSAFFFSEEGSREYLERKEIVARMSNYKAYNFKPMWHTEDAGAYLTDERYRMVLIFYRERNDALKSYRDKAKFSTPAFVQGGIVGMCHYGNCAQLYQRLRLVLIGLNLVEE